MAKYEGAGGYGGISTMNQDQRQGRFWPHIDIFILKQHPVSQVKCFTCKALWLEGDKFPEKCVKKDDWKTAEEVLSGKNLV